MKTPTKKQPAKRKVASKPRLPHSLVTQAMQSPEAARASRALHGALSDALAILAPVHGQDLAQTLVGEIISGSPPPVEPPTPLSPVSVTLSPQASELVRWYVDTIGHQPREAVDGAVFSTLESAKEAYDERPRCDDSFDCLISAVLGSKERFRNMDHVGALKCVTVELDEQATVWLRTFQAKTPESDPRDVVSAAVLFLLDGDTDDNGEAIKAAKARRIAGEQKGAA